MRALCPALPSVFPIHCYSNYTNLFIPHPSINKAKAVMLANDTFSRNSCIFLALSRQFPINHATIDSESD